MVRVDLTKEEFMHAYSSQYYDPVKAHEYYERTKKLKGRSTSGMSDEQKKTWNYVKEDITGEKRQKTEEIQKSSTSTIEGLRSEAAATRERISEKLKIWLEKITGESSSKKQTLSKTAQQQREEIQAERQRKLDALPEIPKTASPVQRERLRMSNEQEKASINTEAKTKLAQITETTSEKRSDISEQTSGEKSSVRENASQERQIVAQKLKTAISSVRDKVKEIKKTLSASTEETLNKEYDNIMTNIAGKPAKSKKGKSSSNDASAKQKFISNNLAKLKSKS